MALIKCPDCNKEVSDRAIACIGCGCPLAPNASVTPQAATSTRGDIVDKLIDKIESKKSENPPHPSPMPSTPAKKADMATYGIPPKNTLSTGGKATLSIAVFVIIVGAISLLTYWGHCRTTTRHTPTPAAVVTTPAAVVATPDIADIPINPRNIISVSKPMRLRTRADGRVVRDSHIVGLNADGSVVTTGTNDFGERNTENWSNIVAVSAGGVHTVGLRADGTVIATGNNQYGQLNVRNWSNIVAISAGSVHTVGLRDDGTVVATGNTDVGVFNIGGPIHEWRDIVAISAGQETTVGLRDDGTVVASNFHDPFGRLDEWVDIVAISADASYILGLRANGTVKVVGNQYCEEIRRFGLHFFDLNEIANWSNIIAVSAGGLHTVGLRADGTVLITGHFISETERNEIESWRNVVAISTGSVTAVGLKADGTVVSIGGDTFNSLNLGSWTEDGVFDSMAITEHSAQVDEDSLHTQLREALYDTSNEITLTISWYNAETTIFRREQNSSHWFMQGRRGDNREVFPTFRDEEAVITIAWERTTDTRLYFLFGDGSGRFGNRDGTRSEQLRWTFTTNSN